MRLRKCQLLISKNGEPKAVVSSQVTALLVLLPVTLRFSFPDNPEVRPTGCF